MSEDRTFYNRRCENPKSYTTYVAVRLILIQIIGWRTIEPPRVII
jgi:hypothetical protein